MADATLLEQIRKVVKEEITASEKRVIKTIETKIDESQEDTIKVLSELIHAGHNDHEERLTIVEEKLHITKN
ncbi:MAG TPA: hypothetical protein VNG51_00015 [Ktedonobacteraceae bacterium]|nr:hypothetical protein [Ktedonobacteraceae bacterium]